MSATPATREDWETFLTDYKAGLTASVPTSAGFNDYLKQVCYFGSLQYFYHRYYDDWDSMPDSMSDLLPCYTARYQSQRDYQMHTSAMFYIFDKMGGVYLASDEFVIEIEFSDYVQSLNVTHNGYQDSNGAYIGWASDSDNNSDQMTITLRQTGNYFGKIETPMIPDPVPYQSIQYSKNDFARNAAMFSTSTFSLPLYFTNSSTTIGNNCEYVGFSWDNIDKYAPWDYYNDEILPTIDPDNAVFPGGYSPVEPDDPPDEPQDLPHDDGEPSDTQDNRRITVPSMFVTQYVLDAAELEELGENLWQSWLTPNTDVQKNFFLSYGQDFGTLDISACMNYIISLKVFPFEFPLDWFVLKDGLRMGTGHTNFLSSHTNGVTVLKSQIYDLDLGECTVELPKPYNDFRDMYNCSILCFMPYCGTVELTPAEVVGRTLKATYYIDCQSGGCTCVIKCAGDAGDYIIASKSGQIGFSLPMTATNAGQLTAQIMKDAVQTAGTISGTVFDVMGKLKDTAISIAGVNQAADNGMDFDYAQKKANYYNAKGDIGIMQSVKNGVLEVANQALDRLSRSGVDMPMLSGGSSADSFFMPDCVFIQVRRGKYAKPDNYPHSQGHINGSSNTISYYKGKFKGNPDTGSNTDKGLCKFTGIDSSGLTCRADERDEIIRLLETGVYL